MRLNFYDKLRCETWQKACVKGEGIFECYHFGQNGSGVFCLWRMMDQVCLGQNGFLWHAWVVWKLLEAMSSQDLHWLQKLGSCKASFGAKVF